MCKVDEYRFYRIFVAYAANVNDFKLGCKLVLFVDGTHLNGPYQGTMLAACTLDADNHLFNLHTPLFVVKKLKCGCGSWKWLLSVWGV